METRVDFDKRGILFLGDCNIILKKIPNNYIDLIATDPPYGISYISGRQTVSGRSGVDVKIRDSGYFDMIAGDDQVPVLWLKEAFRVLKENTALYVFTSWKSWSKLESAVNLCGFKVKNMIVMNKSNHSLGDIKGSYAPKHELVLFAIKGKHILNPEGLKNRLSDVIDVKVKYSGSYHFHPNEKPISWIQPFIEKSSKENEICLDPFFGSGTVGIACLENVRRFLGIEIDKKYFDIASLRIKDYLKEKSNIRNIGGGIG